MKGAEQGKDNAGRLEKLARLGTKKSIGIAALAGAGAILAPPAAAAVLTTVAAIEVVQAAAFPIVEQRLKNQRLRKQQKN